MNGQKIFTGIEIFKVEIIKGIQEKADVVCNGNIEKLAHTTANAMLQSPEVCNYIMQSAQIYLQKMGYEPGKLIMP